MTAGSPRLVDRPLGARRNGAFVAVTAVVLLMAGGLAVTAGNDSAAPGDVPSSQAPPARALVVPPLEAGTAVEGSARDARVAVVRQTRRFLAGYLPYLYGHGPVRALRGGTVELQRRLETARLRVPPAARKRRPRVVRLTVAPLDAGRWHAVATIADGGVARYPIELLLTTRGGVRVAEVSSE